MLVGGEDVVRRGADAHDVLEAYATDVRVVCSRLERDHRALLDAIVAVAGDDRRLPPVDTEAVPGVMPVSADAGVVQARAHALVEIAGEDAGAGGAGRELERIAHGVEQPPL